MDIDIKEKWILIYPEMMEKTKKLWGREVCIGTIDLFSKEKQGFADTSAWCYLFRKNRNDLK